MQPEKSGNKVLGVSIRTLPPILCNSYAEDSGNNIGNSNTSTGPPNVRFQDENPVYNPVQIYSLFAIDGGPCIEKEGRMGDNFQEWDATCAAAPHAQIGVTIDAYLTGGTKDYDNGPQWVGSRGTI